MKKKALLVFGLAIMMILAMSLSVYAAEDLDSFPAEIDPQDWTTNEDITWDAWEDNPVIDWTDLDLPDAQLQKGVLLMCDFADLPFIMTQPKGSDFMGNPQVDPIDPDEVGEFWKELLNVPSELNDYTSIDGFWRENSYGKWKVEIEAFGPYHLEGMEWEYGIDSKVGAKTTKRNIINETLAAFLADDSHDYTLADFTFGFIVHAGYTESAVWQEAGEMMFESKEDIPEFYGPTVEELEALKAWGAKPQGTAERMSNGANDITWAEHLFDGVDPVTGEYLVIDAQQGENWAGTKYVEWTSWKAAKTVWSHTSSYRATEGDGSGLAPGTSWRISCQSEDNGMGTYAHEFGHITGISDNYNNAYAVPYQRTYGGYWELMSAGNQNGPGGTHSRYTIPARKGDVVPSEHTVRLKIKQGFYDEDQYTRFGQESLLENGPVFETIVARNVPTTGEYGVGYGYNGLVLDLTEDKTPIIASTDPAYDWMNVGTFGSYNSRNPYYGKGYYQFYGMEVIQKTGYESFLVDEGVLITINREVNNESAPFIWVIDSHPEDINLVNFTMPSTGEDIMVTPGDSRQLYDALFHAGTGKDVVSEYYDEYNKLHFYVLEKNYDKQGVLSYRVAVRSDEQYNAESYSDDMTLALGDVSEAEAGKVAVQEIKITNNGSQTGLYRLSESNARGWASMLSYEVIEVEAGETVTVPMYVQVPETRAHANDFTFTVTSEVSGKTATLEDTITPPAAELVYNTYEGMTESVSPAYTGKDVKEIPVIDPQDWQVSEDMDWSEWKDNPWIDWSKLSYEDMPGVDVKRGLLLMCDFADLDFIMTMPKGSDFMGNPTTEPITREEVGEYWTTLLNTPCELNDFTSIDGFWRENSYGKWAVEIEAYGPYRLEGMEWEYGLDNMNGGTGKRSIINEVIAAYTADTTEGKPLMKDFDFGFVVHAGYTESAVWQEAGEMMFADKESVPEFYGPTVEELQAIKAWGAKPQGSAEPVYNSRGAVTNSIAGWSMFFDGVDPVTGEFLIIDGKQGGNWAPTRYIPWTSFKAAKSVWSFTSSYRAVAGDNTGLQPGTSWRISVQSEDNGMGTFAHEFGHISGISDNYVSAYTEPAQRTPAGNWELMNAGNQNGPGGTHGRYTIPARKGDVIPAEHTVRLKVKQGFYDEGQASRIDQPSLQQYGPVFETIVARNVPTTGLYGVGYGVNGMIIDLVEDKTPIIPTSSPDYVWNNVATYGSGAAATGYYQNYGIEVIQKTGYESFLHDEGVLISMYRDRESAPYIWVIDSHPEDINIVNFQKPGTDEDVFITKGENRQLNDALFHAGTGEDVVSEYYDAYNKLHFYVLDKMYDEAGVLSYRVAVLSKEFTGEYDDEVAVDLGDASPAKAGNVASQEIIITNLGTQPALYRLDSTNEEGWAWGVTNEVIEVAPGEEVSIPLYFEVPDFRPVDNDFDFTVTSEVTGVSFTVSGTIEPLNGEGVVRPGKDDKDEDEDEDTDVPEIVVPESELSFSDVAVDAWYYNDVLVAVKDGLVNGRTATTYVPEGNITLAEAIKLAASMHQKYTTGAVTLANGEEAWYSTYVEYAVANGIIKEGEYADMNGIATRAQFASIFAAALPAEALTAINAIEDGKVPDVKMADSYGAAVYKLYNAGILTGNDAIGTFAPMTNIKRSEVAAIVNRMMHAENRKAVAL